jgi:putative spermidine/putrescine transport system permease protein
VTGIGARLARIPLAVFSALVLLFLAAPIVIIAVVSFGADQYAAFPPQQWTLRWYQAVLASHTWRRGFQVSLTIASMATVLATLLGLLAALALVRGRLPFKRAVYALLLAPMIVPGIITGTAMYFAFSSAAGAGSLPMIALGHTALALPVASIILSATLQGVDPRIEYAAISLGADRLLVLRRITLPLILPGLISAVLFAFLTSFDEFFVALYFSTPSVSTLPILVWATLTYQIDPSVTAVSTLLIVVTGVALALLAALGTVSNRLKGRIAA